MSPSPGRNPVISDPLTVLFCAWIAPGPDGAEWVWAQWWGRRRLCCGSAAPGWTRGEDDVEPQRRSHVGHGNASVVFDATAGTKADEVFIASISPSNIELLRVTDDDGVPSKYPDVAGYGLNVLTWYDERDGNKEIYLLAPAPTKSARGSLSCLRVASPRRVANRSAHMWRSSDFVLGKEAASAWRGRTTPTASMKSTSSSSIGAPGRFPANRITRNGTSSLIPAIERLRDGFALAWNEYVPAAEGHAGTSEIAFVVVR